MKEQYKKYTELVDKHKQLILDTERYLWKHPQVGYKEWEATEYLVRQYEKMGLENPFIIIDTNHAGLYRGSGYWPSRPEAGADRRAGFAHVRDASGGG